MILAAYNSKWTLLVAVAVVMAALIGWVFPASRMAFNPGAVLIEDGTVTLARTFPGDSFGLPRPVMTYEETIRPLTPMHNGGHPCVQQGGPIRYVSASPVGAWSLDWADDCTSDPTGYYWEAAWVWHIGAFRLGPVRASHTVLRPADNGEDTR
jgi:hypothetical protein